jgi:hypothetical protein
MKKILLVFSFFIVVDCFSQTTISNFSNLITVDDLGFKTYHDVFMEIREEVSLIPCRSYTSPVDPEIKFISYCINDTDNIIYNFYNENLYSIRMETKLIISKPEAENLFKKVTTEKKLEFGIEPKLLNYGMNGSKGSVRYYLTPTGEPDLYKIPLFDKEIASKLSESEFSSEIFGGKIITNLAEFNTPELRISFGIMAKFSENELFFFEAVHLKDYKSDPLPARNP